MADVALRRLQIALEGPYTSGAGPVLSTQESIYNGLTAAYGATRRLSIEKGVTDDFDFTWERPVEARGTYAGAYQSILHQVSSKGKIPVFMYADDLTWYGRMLFSGVPTCQTLPNSAAPATNVGSALTIPSTAGALTGTITAPNTINSGLGYILSLNYNVSTTSSVSQSFTIVGTSVSSAALTEIVTFPVGTQTVYFNTYSATVGAVPSNSWAALTNTNTQATLFTKNYFATVTSITSGANVTGGTLNVGAVAAFQWNFPLDMSVSTLYSSSGEYFDGTMAWSLPGMVAEKYTLTASIGKSLKGDISFSAKNKTALAGYAAASGTNGIGGTAGSLGLTANGGYNGVSYGTAGSIPVGTFWAMGYLLDNITNAIPTYAAKVYAVNIGTDPGTGTLINARLTDYKFDIDNKVKLGKAADGTPNPNFVGRDYYGEGLTGEMTLLLNESSTGASAGTTGAELTNFLNQQSRTVRVAFPGVALPCGTLGSADNWPNWGQDANSKGGYYGMAFDIAGKYTKAGEKEVDARQAISFTVSSEVDLTFLNAPAQVILINRISPLNSF